MPTEAEHCGFRGSAAWAALSGRAATRHIPEWFFPPPPLNHNCGDIPFRNIKVVVADPHNFDADNDGIGCESQ